MTIPSRRSESQNEINDLLVINKEMIDKMKKKRLTKLVFMIDKFKKKRSLLKPIEISRTNYFCYKYFFCCIYRSKGENIHKVKKQIIKLAEKEMYHRMDLINIMKHHDKLKILSKILLNKHQLFMLKHKSKQIVFNKYNDNIEEEEQLIKEQKIIDLILYLKEKKELQTLIKEDYVLLENLDNDIKERVVKEAELEI